MDSIKNSRLAIFLLVSIFLTKITTGFAAVIHDEFASGDVPNVPGIDLGKLNNGTTNTLIGSLMGNDERDIYNFSTDRPFRIFIDELLATQGLISFGFGPVFTWPDGIDRAYNSGDELYHNRLLSPGDYRIDFGPTTGDVEYYKASIRVEVPSPTSLVLISSMVLIIAGGLFWRRRQSRKSNTTA